jgi:hypothetical protein
VAAAGATTHLGAQVWVLARVLACGHAVVGIAKLAQQLEDVKVAFALSKLECREAFLARGGCRCAMLQQQPQHCRARNAGAVGLCKVQEPVRWN